MRLSYNWLRQYINLDLSPEETSILLTNIGLEVESLDRFESVPGSLAGLVVGEVLTCSPHPQADRLSLTTVDVGETATLSIVCGAPNVAAGQKVVVAPAGTTLYGLKEPLTLRKTRIRGEWSEGMICAEDEIGIGKDHSGIIILDNSALPGTPLSSLFEIESDYVFEIGLTPNRIDSASHFGVARELMAALGSEKKLQLTRPPVRLPQKEGDHHIPVKIMNQEACIRYSGITIGNVRVTESPGWLRNRLASIDMTPINNIVDITNFVLHETGQPLHAFDARYITGNQIIVRTLSEGTRFVTLDGEERQLSSQDLMICNEKEGMCIAGVFGGLQSGVTGETTSIFLESACFNPVWIRRTSKRHQIFTDSSFRFERGTDPNGTVNALMRAAGLICEIAGGRIESEIIDVYPKPVGPFKVILKWSNLDRLVGISIDRDEVKTILKSLDIEIEKENDQELQLAVATYRVDVRREADVIEEILRIYGYNNVGITDQVVSTLTYAQHPDPDYLEDVISGQLTAQGFNEIMANSLTRSAYLDGLPSFASSSTVKLLNPLSTDLNSLRRTLLFGGIEAIATNVHHRNPDLRLYEFGQVYRLKTGGNRLMADGYEETRCLAIWITGMTHAGHWSVKQDETSFFELKSYVNLILKRLGLALEMIEIREQHDERFLTGVTGLMDKIPLVMLGRVHPDVLALTDIEQPVWFAEINWDLLLEHANLQVRLQELARFPRVRRDLALVVDRSIRYEQIRSLAFLVERKLLRDVNVFDVYTSEKFGPGKKSLAVSFILQDESKTLTDKQIDQVMENLVKAFEKKLGAVLR